MHNSDSFVPSVFGKFRENDIDEFLNFVVKKVLDPKTLENTTTYDIPHVQPSDSTFVRERGSDRFFRVPSDPNGHTFQSVEQFEQLRFNIVGTENTNRCVIEVRFQRDDEIVATKEIEYHTGNFDGRGVVPIDVTTPESTTEAEVRIQAHDRQTSLLRETLRRLTQLGEVTWEVPSSPAPAIGVPSAVQKAGASHPPIIIISVDSLRYDRLDNFAPLLDKMGDHVTIPEQPRTQGTSTWPAHASLFTGLHPLEHGCTSDAIGPRINPDVTTLWEMLEQQGYRTSGCVSSWNLSPQIGYGRGFHRYQVQDIDWKQRNRDARSIFRTFENWLADDLESGATRVAYFLHLFDIHYPYIPPYPKTDRTEYDYRVYDKYIELAENRDYVEMLTEDPLEITPEEVEEMTSLYDECLEYIVRELCKLIETLKSHDLFDDALLVILGDHGEDFYENNFLFHHSLYEENIRPGVIIKPPACWQISVPDELDYIDILPMLANHLGVNDIREQTTGIPFSERSRDRPRITERKLESYNVAVEEGDSKAIFTYCGSEEPADLVAAGPTYVESTDREASYARIEKSADLTTTERRLERHVRELTRERTVYESRTGEQLSKTAENRLEELGYK